MVKIAPSILAADMLNLERDVQRMIDAGCDMLHVDVMDAHFVPNLSYGPAVVKALHKRFTIPLDVHLMMDNPEKYLDVFCDAGAAWLTIHAEIPGDVAGMLRHIRSRGVKAGLSLKPGTPVEAVGHLLPLTDMALVMTVEPGFGGQAFMPEALPKLAEARMIADSADHPIEIEVDGGISPKNAAAVIAAGADVLVAGSSIFHADDIREAVYRLRACEKNPLC